MMDPGKTTDAASQEFPKAEISKVAPIQVVMYKRVSWFITLSPSALSVWMNDSTVSRDRIV